MAAAGMLWQSISSSSNNSDAWWGDWQTSMQLAQAKASVAKAALIEPLRAPRGMEGRSWHHQRRLQRIADLYSVGGHQ